MKNKIPHVCRNHALGIALLAGLLSPAWLCAAGDWLVHPEPFAATVTPSADEREVELQNGLVRRVIRLRPNAWPPSLWTI